MLSENKFTKYLLYAIGEIILVVIGILIALQINNWNEDKKQEIIEIKYLKRLKIDLGKDENLWANLYQSRKTKTQYMQELIALNFNTQKDTIDFAELARNMKTALTWNRINPNQDTFAEMLSSGNIDIIQNDSIKIKLITLNNQYTSVKNWDNSSGNTHKRIMEENSKHYNVADFAPLSDKFSSYVDIKFERNDYEKALESLKKAVEKMISEKIALNNIDVLSDNYHRQINVFKNLENDVGELIDLILLEIKNRVDD